MNESSFSSPRLVEPGKLQVKGVLLGKIAFANGSGLGGDELLDLRLRRQRLQRASGAGQNPRLFLAFRQLIRLPIIAVL